MKEKTFETVKGVAKKIRELKIQGAIFNYKSVKI